MLVSGEKGKPGVHGKKPKRTEQRTNKPNPHMRAGQEIKPAPQWWNCSHRFPDPALQKTGNNEPESYSGSESTLSTTANPSIPEIRRGREVVSLLHRLRSPAVSELSRIRKLSVNSVSKSEDRRQRRTGKILLGELNIICPNETCWSQTHKMILSWRQVFFAIPWEHGRSK